MEELDKQAMGKRIRQIRLAAGMRQWELARLLGTTQSAVHKYEHGVVPEPRRLVELARVGQTSIEWVLTGRHWENGSQSQERLSPDVLSTATVLREIGDSERARVEEAIRIVREAVRALQGDALAERAAQDASRAALLDHGRDTLRVLETAWRIQRSVLRKITEDTERRLEDDGNGNRPAGAGTDRDALPSG